jgi:FkbM family methyltransferase
VGGNQGTFAYYMAKLSKIVHVFEPNPICLAEIERIRTRNMIVHETALSDRAGRLPLRFDPNNTGIGTIEASNKLDNNVGIREVIEREVEIARLDDFGLEEVAFVKVDVEGHEPAVIRGATGIISQNRPALLIECERRHNETAFEELVATLAPFGYASWRWADSRLVPVSNSDLENLQSGIPETNPDYVNNFLFLTDAHAERLRVAV